MPYRSKATKEREEWMTLPEAIRHICVADKCDEDDAQKQLRSALADDALHNASDSLLLDAVALWADGESQEDILKRIVATGGVEGETEEDRKNRIAAEIKRRDFQPHGRRWEDVEINWHDGTVRNVWTGYRSEELRAVLVSREALITEWPIAKFHDPTAHKNPAPGGALRKITPRRRVGGKATTTRLQEAVLGWLNKDYPQGPPPKTQKALARECSVALQRNISARTLARAMGGK